MSNTYKMLTQQLAYQAPGEKDLKDTGAEEEQQQPTPLATPGAMGGKQGNKDELLELLQQINQFKVPG